MAIYFSVVFGFYFLLLLMLLFGWRKAIHVQVNPSSKNIFISVVIAMRNEKENLDSLLKSLSQQTYSDFEIIIVDDHSEDGSAEKVNEWATFFHAMNIVSLNGDQNGKKAALSLGIKSAKGEVIATTDADCVVPANWLQRINEGFQNEKANILVGAVALQNGNGLFSSLQAIEFTSVIGTGIATCALGKPTMCNGANLAFRKKIFDEVNGYSGNEHIASGDDEFLMRKILEKYPDSVSALNPIGNIVNTKPQPSVKKFIQQRLRWASKWKANSSWVAKFFAVFIFVIQLSWLSFLSWTVYDFQWLMLAVLVLKVVIDFVFLFTVCRSLKMKFAPLAFVALQFLYPLYVLYIGLFSQFRSYPWKERKFV